MSNPTLYARGRELGISTGQHSWQPWVLTQNHFPRGSFHHSSHFTDKELETQWLVIYFLSDRIGIRTQLPFHPSFISAAILSHAVMYLTLCQGCSGEQALLPPCSHVLLPGLLSLPHVLPVFRVVLLYLCTTGSQATGGQGQDLQLWFLCRP